MKLLLEANVKTIFSRIEEIDKEFYEDLLSKIFKT
jgi:hypothetical protein